MNTRNQIKNFHNKTVKNFSSFKINGNLIEKKHGWKIIHIFGEPYMRGIAHGYLLRNELKKAFRTFSLLVKKEVGMSYSAFITLCRKMMKPILIGKYCEFYDEIRGISAGAKKGGVNISVDFLIAWNSYISMSYYLKKNINFNKCSAFIATGDATETGDIIMAHDTHSDFLTGQLQNIIIYITPESGHPFVMQTSAGFICSVTDWFLCSTGIIGCETTISGIKYKPELRDPYFCRIRKAMQYGKDFDDYVEIMTTNNSGDYACSWLLGNVNDNEIMLFELGLKHKNVKRTKNGVFYGMNSAISDEIREHETTDIDHNNTSSSVGARNYRLNELLNKKYRGKVNITNAKAILADHFDVHLNRNVMNGRSICKHLEFDKEHCKVLPYSLFGCTDAKVVDTTLAKKMQFIARYGSACGREFSVKDHINKHPEFAYLRDYVEDVKREKWTNISM